jgi:hypothetical protein
MIRPASFGYNSETAETNSFQKQQYFVPSIQDSAVREFDEMVSLLRKNDIQTLIFQDTLTPKKSCSVFPNNWFCTMPNGSLTVFPMQAVNRRSERRQDIIDTLREKYIVSSFKDWSKYEHVNWFLESTGSMVMDHVNSIIYACISPRTGNEILEKYARSQGYNLIKFTAADPLGNAIYHTNVMLHIGNNYAVICGEAIADKKERNAVFESLIASGLTIIDISMHQVFEFAGNMLQVENLVGERITALSRRAYNSLSRAQLKELTKQTWLLPVNLDIIEKAGGGSVRCMMAEIFLEAVVSNEYNDEVTD